MVLPALIMTLVVAQPSVPTEALPESNKPEVRHWEGLGVPLLSFNTDTGVGFGAVGGAYVYEPGYKPFAHAISLQLFATTGGEQNHFIQYDGPRLLGQFRLEARAQFRRERFEPFYGVGNFTLPGQVYVAGRTDLAYDRIFPGIWTRLRTHPFGDDHPFQVYFGYTFDYTRISPYSGSVLLQTQPLGMRGGVTSEIVAGALWDTRDNEFDAHHGQMHLVAVRTANVATGSRYSFTGLTAQENAFWSPIPRVVIGERLLFDAMLGNPPFYLWNDFGGLNMPFGLGGVLSIRGVPLDRYIGNFKVFSNTEIRVSIKTFYIFGKDLTLGALAFFDTGRVWHPGVPSGPWYALHSGTGGGIRASHREAVIRVDYGVDIEHGRGAWYVIFGHMF